MSFRAILRKSMWNTYHFFRRNFLSSISLRRRRLGWQSHVERIRSNRTVHPCDSTPRDDKQSIYARTLSHRLYVCVTLVAYLCVRKRGTRKNNTTERRVHGRAWTDRGGRATGVIWVLRPSFSSALQLLPSAPSHGSPPPTTSIPLSRYRRRPRRRSSLLNMRVRRYKFNQL